MAKLIKKWHSQITKGSATLHKLKHPKHKYPIMNGLAVFVELEHEIDAHRSDTSAIFDVYNFFYYAILNDYFGNPLTEVHSLFSP